MFQGGVKLHRDKRLLHWGKTNVSREGVLHKMGPIKYKMGYINITRERYIGHRRTKLTGIFRLSSSQTRTIKGRRVKNGDTFAFLKEP